jgi:hypothetical protein
MELSVVTALVLVSWITLLSFLAPSRLVTRMTLRTAPPEPIPASRQQNALNACHRRPLHFHAIPNALAHEHDGVDFMCAMHTILYTCSHLLRQHTSVYVSIRQHDAADCMCAPHSIA